MNDSSNDYLDDPNFKIVFVNKKSHERVLEIINSIKSSLQPPDSKLDQSPYEAISKASQDQTFFLNENIFKSELNSKTNENVHDSTHQETALNSHDFPPPQKPTFSSHRLSSLKPFLLSSFPTQTILPPDSTYQQARQDILYQSRIEQHKLLWAFQDRIIHDLLHQNEEIPLHSHAELALNQIAKDQVLPIDKYETKSHINEIMINTQKQAIALSNHQKGSAKLLADQKLFDIQYKSDASKDHELSIPIINPFGFLTSLNTSK